MEEKKWYCLGSTLHRYPGVGLLGESCFNDQIYVKTTEKVLNATIKKCWDEINRSIEADRGIGGSWPIGDIIYDWLRECVATQLGYEIGWSSFSRFQNAEEVDFYRIINA